MLTRMNWIVFALAFILTLAVPSALAQDEQTIVLQNEGGAMEGHTPRGFQGMGTGLFAGDNLNSRFPDGDGVQIFISFDLSDLPDGEISSAILRSEHVSVFGSPFDDLGVLTAEEIRYDSFSSELWNLDPLAEGASCEFATSGDGPFECDLTEAVQGSLADSFPYAQFRLRLDEAGDNDSDPDLVMFFISDSNTNEPGIFELEITLGSGVDLERGLVAHYPFNGDADDLSGNDNHGEANGAVPAENRLGEANAAYAFDGADDFIQIPDSDSLDISEAITISGWLFYEEQASSSFYTILEKSDPGDGHARYGAWIIGDLVEFCVEPAVNEPRQGPQRCLDSTESLIEDEWNHFAGVYDGQELRLYLNGEFAGNRAYSPSGISQNDAPLFVATDRFQPSVLYTRSGIDDIRIYSRALTEAEIGVLAALDS